MTKEEELYTAASTGDYAKVKSLIKDKANINYQRADGAGPLFIAAQFGHAAVVERLLEEKAINPNLSMNDGCSPIYIASQNGRTDAVRVLLKAPGVDPMRTYGKNCTALYIAAQKGHAEIVQMLLSDPRVDPNFPMTDSSTPFFIACQMGQTEVVKVFQKFPKADLNKCMNDGCSPFFIACQKNCTGVVQALVSDPRVDVNKQMNDQCSPVFIACSRGNEAVLDILLKEPRADPLRPDERARAPRTMCRVKGFTQMYTKIVNHIRNVMQITPQKEVEFIQANLVAGGPKFYEAVSRVRDLLEDPETRPLVLNTKFPNSSFTLLETFFQLLPKLPSANDLFACGWTIEPLSKIESVRKAALKVNGYVCMVQALLSISAANNNYRAVLPVSTTLSTGKDIQESIAAGFPKLLSTLSNLISTGTMADWIKTDMGSMVLLLCGYYPTEREAHTIAYNFVTKATTINLSDRALDGLMRAASVEVCRPILLSLGLKTFVNPYIANPESPEGFASCLIQALLSASDVSSTSESGGEPASPVAINRVLKAVDQFTSSKIVWIETTKTFTAELSVIMTAIRSLATNEENQRTLKERDIVSLIVRLFQSRNDLLVDNRENLTEACNLVWVLTFDQKNQQDFIKEGMVNILKSFKITDHEGVKRAIAGALWNLEGKDIQVENAINQKQKQQQAQQVSGTAPAPIGHVMISYSWAQKDRMRDLGLYIKSLGYPVWLDIEQMEGSVLERMSEAIEEASVVIIGLSSNYKESQACRTEAEYSFKLRKEVIYVMAEEGYTPKGWLGAMLGNKLWYNPWSSPSLETGSAEIVKLLKKVTQPTSAPTAPPAPTAQSSAPAPAPSASSAGVAKTRTVVSYDSVQVPESKGPLTPADLFLPKVATWDNEYVCRWLRANQLDKLLAPFVFHEIDGKALLHLASLKEADRLLVWDSLQIDGRGLFLSFEFLLARLISSPRTWQAPEVANWLETVGLVQLVGTAVEQAWNGAVLYGLFQSIQDGSFSQHTADFSLTKVASLQLKGHLSTLFQSTP